MHADIAAKRHAIAELCRRFGVTRLEVFGSAARGDDFEAGRSDIDFLVSFNLATRDDMTVFLDLKESLEALLNRPVDLIDREAVEASRNHIRRRAILSEAQAVTIQ